MSIEPDDEDLRNQRSLDEQNLEESSGDSTVAKEEVKSPLGIALNEWVTRERFPLFVKVTRCYVRR